MTSQHLPTFKLSRLHDKRHKTAVSALSFVLGRSLPDGLPDSDGFPEKLVEFSLSGLEAMGLASVDTMVETVASCFSLAFLSHLLTKPSRLSYQSGDTTLVADTRRFDLVAVLTKLQVTLGDPRLRLVAPAVLFSDACYNYRWRGTIFSFALGVSGGAIRAEYVSWHPSPSYVSRSASGLSVIRVQHRHKSEERGQT